MPSASAPCRLGRRQYAPSPSAHKYHNSFDITDQIHIQQTSICQGEAYLVADNDDLVKVWC
jgi:hypothetical protein